MAEKLLADEGVKVTGMVHWAPTASGAVQLGAREKLPEPAPVIAIEIPDRATVPVLASTTDIGSEDVFSTVVGNDMVVGVTEAVTDCGAVAVPVSVRTVGEETVLSVTVIVSLSEPDALGPNANPSLQLAFTESVEPQSFCEEGRYDVVAPA